MRDAGGLTVRNFYDEDRRLTRTENADGASTASEFDAAGRLVKVTTADGAARITVYDAAGQAIAQVDPLGHVTQTQYTPTGTVKKTIDARDHETVFQHDTLDRVLSATNALGYATSSTYGADGEVTVTVNARGKETRYTYDLAQRLLQATDPNGGTVKREYDSAGSVTKVTDEEGRRLVLHVRIDRTQDQRDGPERAPHRVHVQRGGRAHGGPHARPGPARVFPRRRGRVIRKELYKANVLEDTELTTYDVRGNALVSENGAHKTTRQFDALRRETRRVVLSKATNATRELGFTYDLMGRRQAMSETTPGRITTYAYCAGPPHEGSRRALPTPSWRVSTTLPGTRPPTSRG